MLWSQINKVINDSMIPPKRNRKGLILVNLQKARLQRIIQSSNRRLYWHIYGSYIEKQVKRCHNLTKDLNISIRERCYYLLKRERKMLKSMKKLSLQPLIWMNLHTSMLFKHSSGSKHHYKSRRRQYCWELVTESWIRPFDTLKRWE